MQRTTLQRLLLPIAILAIAVALFGYLRATKPTEPQPKPSEKAWQVDIIAAAPGRHAPGLTLYGSVSTPSLVRPAAPAAGVVTEVAVRDGQRVSAGTRLLAMDPRDFRPTVDQARAELADYDAQVAAERLRSIADRRALAEEKQLLDLADAAVERAQRLKTQKLGADSALDEAHQARVRQVLAVTSRKLAVDSAGARLQQLEARRARQQARLAEAELALERSVVLAPFDGIVAAVHVAAGDRIAAGTVQLELYPVDDLEVRARIATRYQEELQAALANGRPLHATADYGGRELRLDLVRIAGISDPSGVDAYFRVTTGGETLRLGNLLRLDLFRPIEEESIPVPYRALYGNDRLYLLRDGRMSGIDITLLGPQAGDGTAGRVLIRSSAIAAGDAIIVTHLPNAVTGLPVRRTER